MPKTSSKKAEAVWILLDQKQPLIYRKEAIYLGDWGKLNSEGEGIEFNVYRDTLEHWKQSTEQFRKLGIAIPLSKSHDNWDRTEDRLGEVIAASVKPNSKGKPSLFLDIRFDDEKSRDIALKGDVSIGSPPTWYDGAKNKHVYPLQHVASTAAPVIPGLETWQAIAAAFGESKSKGSNMEIDELIALLGIEVDESVNTDDGKKALVMAKLKELVGAPAKKPEGEGEAGKEGEGTPSPVDASLNSGAQPAEPAKERDMKKVTVAFSHLQVKTVRKGRQAELDSYVAQGKMSPATAKEIALAHCDDKAIGLELSHNGDGSAFDREVAIALSATKHKPLSKSGRTEAGDDSDEAIIELSHSGKGQGFSSFVDKQLAGSK